MSYEDGYDPELYWNPAPKPTPSVASGVTPAVDRAIRATPRLRLGLSTEEVIRPGLAAALEVDALSNIIRKVDGNHELGAGALAEAIRAEILGES